MRIYIMTCVSKQDELEFLKLYKFCALLPPDVATNYYRLLQGHVQCRAALCTFQPTVLTTGQSKRTLESLLSDVMWN
jgi:hypothetical protein